MLIAIAVFTVTVMSSFAADVPTPDTTAQRMPPHYGMKMEKTPSHMLVMAYHKNLLTFANALDKVAHKGDTVPREFARTAVAEMRRSTDELEKYRAEVLHNMPADVKAHGDMQKMMDEHLVNVKSHLRELEALVKNDRIPSQEVIKQLEFIVKGCQGMDSAMTHGKGMHCRDMHGKWMHNKGMQGCQGCQGCQGERMMQDRGRAMQEMMLRMKAQGAEMAKLVDNMNRAPKDQKVNLLAEIVTRMVQQHTAMTAHMEKMMQKRMHHHDEGASMPPSSTMTASPGEDNDNDEDADTDDSDNDEDSE